jgi:hypothetical protein
MKFRIWRALASLSLLGIGAFCVSCQTSTKFHSDNRDSSLNGGAAPASTTADLETALDSSKSLPERRKATLHLPLSELPKLRAALQARFPHGMDDLNLLVGVGDNHTADFIEQFASSIVDTGKFRSLLDSSADIIRYANARDPAQDTKLTTSELARLDADTDPGTLPDRNERADLLCKDKDGYVYIKLKGRAHRGYAAGYNINTFATPPCTAAAAG